jgi:arylsulfatase A-like enzyme
MAYEWVKSIATYLNEAGYTTHLSGKTHISPKSVFPFEYSGKDNNPDPTVFAQVLKSGAETGKSPSFSSPHRTSRTRPGTRAIHPSIRPHR